MVLVILKSKSKTKIYSQSGYSYIFTTCCWVLEFSFIMKEPRAFLFNSKYFASRHAQIFPINTMNEEGVHVFMEKPVKLNGYRSLWISHR